MTNIYKSPPPISPNWELPNGWLLFYWGDPLDVLKQGHGTLSDPIVSLTHQKAVLSGSKLQQWLIKEALQGKDATQTWIQLHKQFQRGSFVVIERPELANLTLAQLSAQHILQTHQMASDFSDELRCLHICPAEHEPHILCALQLALSISPSTSLGASHPFWLDVLQNELQLICPQFQQTWKTQISSQALELLTSIDANELLIYRDQDGFGLYAQSIHGSLVRQGVLQEKRWKKWLESLEKSSALPLSMLTSLSTDLLDQSTFTHDPTSESSIKLPIIQDSLYTMNYEDTPSEYPPEEEERELSNKQADDLQSSDQLRDETLAQEQEQAQEEQEQEQKQEQEQEQEQAQVQAQAQALTAEQEQNLTMSSVQESQNPQDLPHHSSSHGMVEDASSLYEDEDDSLFELENDEDESCVYTDISLSDVSLTEPNIQRLELPSQSSESEQKLHEQLKRSAPIKLTPSSSFDLEILNLSESESKAEQHSPSYQNLPQNLPQKLPALSPLDDEPNGPNTFNELRGNPDTIYQEAEEIEPSETTTLNPSKLNEDSNTPTRIDLDRFMVEQVLAQLDDESPTSTEAPPEISRPSSQFMQTSDYHSKGVPTTQHDPLSFQGSIHEETTKVSPQDEHHSVLEEEPTRKVNLYSIQHSENEERRRSFSDVMKRFKPKS